jgi:hypothetical protein
MSFGRDWLAGNVMQLALVPGTCIRMHDRHAKIILSFTTEFWMKFKPKKQDPFFILFNNMNIPYLRNIDNIIRFSIRYRTELFSLFACPSQGVLDSILYHSSQMHLGWRIWLYSLSLSIWPSIVHILKNMSNMRWKNAVYIYFDGRSFLAFCEVSNPIFPPRFFLRN